MSGRTKGVSRGKRKDGGCDGGKEQNARFYVKMQSAASPHFYVTQKNRHNTKERLELKKSNPVVRRHVIYKEAKL